MLRFVVRRLVVALLFVVVVASCAFLLVRLAPGDATTKISRDNNETIAAARHRLGLDQPAVTQLFHWMGGLVRLDLGQSSSYQRPVAGLVGDRMKRTASLAALSLLVAVGVGLPLGLLTGTRRQSLLTGFIATISVALLCCPPIIGTLALLFLGVATGWPSVAQGHYLLPTLALALPLAAMLERLQSQAAAEAMGAPDIIAAAARGVTKRRLVWMHAGRQSLRPVLGVTGIVVATLFSGSIAVESITGWLGLGELTLAALRDRDLYLAAGCALAGASLIALGNLGADVLRVVADPRVGDPS